MGDSLTCRNCGEDLEFLEYTEEEHQYLKKYRCKECNEDGALAWRKSNLDPTPPDDGEPPNGRYGVVYRG